MNLPYDPTSSNFWPSIQSIPGFPYGDEIRLQILHIESGALFRLPQTLEALGADRQQPLLVVMDSTPMQREGESLKPLLLGMLQQAGWHPEPYVLEPDADEQVHTDMPHIHAVQDRLAQAFNAGAPFTAVVSVGSGVVTDVTKHACCLYEQGAGRRMPFVIFQTANSVNAFTSNMAPTFVQGVKRTLPSRYADALVCDLETLRDAPYTMTAAGVGDLLAAFVAVPDWYLAHHLGMDPGYSELPQILMGPFDRDLLEHARAIHSGSLEAVELLTKLITLSGLCMSLSHASTPASGFEHVLSHVLDLQNELEGRPLPAHGSQASLAAILGARTYQIFLKEFDPAAVIIEKCFPELEKMQQEILRVFAAIDPSGKAGEECWNDYRVKLEAWRANPNRVNQFLRDWPEIKVKLLSLSRPPQQLQAILSAAACPQRFAELQPPISAGQVRFAYLNAALMRRRLTIGDALVFFGWDQERLWQRVWQG